MCGDHRRPQTLAEMCRNMGICYGFRSVATRVKYLGFMQLCLESIGNCWIPYTNATCTLTYTPTIILFPLYWNPNNIITENHKLLWCQLCHHWWCWSFSVWQTPVSPVIEDTTDDKVDILTTLRFSWSSLQSPKKYKPISWVILPFTTSTASRQYGLWDQSQPIDPDTLYANDIHRCHILSHW